MSQADLAVSSAVLVEECISAVGCNQARKHAIRDAKQHNSSRQRALALLDQSFRALEDQLRERKEALIMQVLSLCTQLYTSDYFRLSDMLKKKSFFFLSKNLH